MVQAMDQLGERIARLEERIDGHIERYDRDAADARNHRASVRDDIKAVRTALADIAKKEQQAIGMMRMAKFGWVVLVGAASLFSWIGLPKIAAALYAVTQK